MAMCLLGMTSWLPLAGQYWRTWNMPVHKWMLRHVFQPLLNCGVPKALAGCIVFGVSGVFHELLVGVPLHMASFTHAYAFWGIMGQVHTRPSARPPLPWSNASSRCSASVACLTHHLLLVHSPAGGVVVLQDAGASLKGMSRLCDVPVGADGIRHGVDKEALQQLSCRKPRLLDQLLRCGSAVCCDDVLDHVHGTPLGAARLGQYRMMEEAHLRYHRAKTGAQHARGSIGGY